MDLSIQFFFFTSLISPMTFCRSCLDCLSTITELCLFHCESLLFHHCMHVVSELPTKCIKGAMKRKDKFNSLKMLPCPNNRYQFDCKLPRIMEISNYEAVATTHPLFRDFSATSQNFARKPLTKAIAKRHNWATVLGPLVTFDHSS